MVLYVKRIVIRVSDETTWNVTMCIKRLLLVTALLGLAACGGGGGSSGSTTPDQPSGYDPSLPEQTLTADQLADVSEIVSTTTVTVEDDVKIASDAKDLVVKGNLIIK